MGHEVIWLLGQPHHFLDKVNKNCFFIMGDMMKNVRNIDVIVTATVMDCLPSSAKAVLVDHISFAPLEVELLVNDIYSGSRTLPSKYSSREEFFERYTAFMGFLPYYDLILTPSTSISLLANRVLEMTGYSQLSNNSFLMRGLNHIKYFFGGKRPLSLGQLAKKSWGNLNLLAIQPFINAQNFKGNITVAQTGYPKLDVPIKKFSNTKPDNTIVYAPTPNDLTGNKQSSIWSKAVTINEHGIDIMLCLLKNFPDKNIVFKPYKNELPDVVSAINDQCASFNNYRLDQSGSDYWELYSKADILISDFSSTAYTFALGLQRPVVFFSPHEHSLSPELMSGSYCASRDSVGLVANSIEQLAKMVAMIYRDYDLYCNKVSEFSSKHFFKAGQASLAASNCICNLIKPGTVDESIRQYIWEA